jgi:hypothetical protein
MFELFHAISDEGSAKVRRYVVEHEVEVRFRNVTYDEVMVDLRAHGGKSAPALWDGERLVSGADAIIERLANTTS